MITRLQARTSALGVVATLAYATATLIWLLAAAPGRGEARWLPAYLVLVSLAAAFLPGLANQVTWSRAWLAGPAFFFASHAQDFGALAGTVVVAAGTDVLDGFLARRRGDESRLGGALDPVVDGLLYGAVGLGLWRSHLLPGWLGLVVGLRYALPAAVGAIALLAGRQPELRHTVLGQASTTIIALVLGGAALLRALGADPRWVLTLGAVLIPLSAVLAFGNLARARLRAPSPG